MPEISWKERGFEMGVLVSVIVATYNRSSKIIGLLEDLIFQDRLCFDVECLVVNDGSEDNTSKVLETFAQEIKSKNLSGFNLLILNQQNTGQAKARQNAIDKSSGKVLVILDDDMRIPSKNFLHCYLNHFFPNLEQKNLNLNNVEIEPLNLVVLGRIDPPEDSVIRPPFEYFREKTLEQNYQNFLAQKRLPEGGDLFTGNVALNKKAFLLCGGFLENFKYAEDKELGIRLEKISKCEFKFETQAKTIHYSDTPSMAVFIKRSKQHGFYDCQIQKMHPENPKLGPANLLNLPGRLRNIIILTMMHSSLCRSFLVNLFSFLAEKLIKFKLIRLSVAACSIVFLGKYIEGAIDGMEGLKNLKKNLNMAKIN
jgi:glycosyltransferase involved in cell wall biosynthesis